MLRINIITLFKGFFDSPLQVGVLGRAIRRGFLKVCFVNPRDFATGAYRSVDDSPFGGADGMVMKFDPLRKALLSLPHRGRVVYLSPRGGKWNWHKARQWVQSPASTYTLVCGRYGGVDERFISKYVEEEISVGDYVLSGGEAAGLVMLDSLCRFVKGVLGNEESVACESFENHQLLEAPQWTQPREVEGMCVPSVMLSGHHQNIQTFRHRMSVLLTALRRADLLDPSYKKTDLPRACDMALKLPPEELKACGLTVEQIKSLIPSL